MRSPGADRPGEEPDESREQQPRGRRWGRGRQGASGSDPIESEEFGWIDDLRSAKEQRADIGPADRDVARPGPSTAEPRPSSGSAPPGPSGRHSAADDQRPGGSETRR